MIDGDLIQSMTAKTKGSSGPSQMDANMWHRILLLKSFGDRSTDLSKAIAKITTMMCTERCDKKNGSDMEAFLSCTLVPLNKNPGVRPIGIGEVLRRIVGKSVTTVLKKDIQDAAGNLQLCAGQLGGCETAVHAMAEIFEEDNTEAILLVDASNAFNSINRSVMIQNIKITCPSLSMFVENCYRHEIRLFVIGGAELKSTEGTTQGDPIATALYGLSLLPAYADDLTGAGKIRLLKMWWDLLSEIGPRIGYYPKPSKSWLIVKPQYAEYAKKIFNSTSIRITVKGQKHLGAVIGSIDFRNEYITKKWQCGLKS